MPINSMCNITHLLVGAAQLYAQLACEEHYMLPMHSASMMVFVSSTEYARRDTAEYKQQPPFPRSSMLTEAIPTPQTLQSPSAHDKPRPHPDLARIHLLWPSQMLLIADMSSLRTQAALDEAIVVATKTMTRFSSVLRYGHPMRRIVCTELGKLLAVDEPVLHTQGSTVEEALRYPPSSTKRLWLALETLVQVRTELTVGFRVANEGGAVGRGVQETAESAGGHALQHSQGMGAGGERTAHTLGTQLPQCGSTRCVCASRRRSVRGDGSEQDIRICGARTFHTSKPAIECEGSQRNAQA
ncbi:hypothetical protein B0H10DRAFT_1944933 [Mycena sp. CBHHK59/15]|nr:hypothetical protein B0H10DRAFT_1944933 [Mycena sp. CBHHK59/15]